MHTDELRAELADLANEVAPFEGDLSGARRRVAMRRAMSGSIAAVVAIALIVAVVAGTHSGPSRLHVAAPAKEVDVTRLQRLDAAVVLPAGATSVDVAHVQAALDRTNAVVSFATLPARSLALALFSYRDASSDRLRTRVCADPSTPIFAVELSRAVPHALSSLTSAIGTTATVQSIGKLDVDFEIFMVRKATASQVSAVHFRIVGDADVIKDIYLDHRAAYAEFKKLFRDQPALIQSVTPQSLPESFRVELRDGAPTTSQVAARYRHLPGVQSVIAQPSGLLTGVPSSILGQNVCKAG